ncbi:MAG: TRAP transporter substrate-binding protein DctP [Treponema sp.]|nr:TRAP transporter substrate-binding protein DctP [Treponema sp.]
MKKSAAVFSAVLVFLLAAPGMVFAQRGGRAGGDVIEIRVASPLPRNSDWGRTLDRIAGEWARVTNNTVRTRVIHDGLEGGEPRMLSSLSTNNVQAALFTSFGLAEIVPEIMSLSVPFKIRDDAELNLVLYDVLPVLEEKTVGTNFIVLAWSKAGWVNIFSRDQILEPNDLRRMRMATNTESENMNSVFRSMGFTLVETEVANMGTMLASGTINAIYQSPAAIAPMGLHRNLGHMLDMPIAPFMGGIVLNRVTWDRLGPERQRAMMDVTRRIASEFDSSMPRTVANAVTMMQRDGLSVNVPNARQRELWQDEVERAMPPLLGQTFDRGMHDRINVILERSRNGQ